MLSGLLATSLFEPAGGGASNATLAPTAWGSGDEETDAVLLAAADSLAAAQLATLAVGEEAVGTNTSLFKSSNRASASAGSVGAGSSAAFLPVGASVSLSEFGVDPHGDGSAVSKVVRLSSTATGVNATLSFAVSDDEAEARRLTSGAANGTVELACVRGFVGDVSGICAATGDVVSAACEGVEKTVTVVCPAPIVACAVWDAVSGAWDGSTCVALGKGPDGATRCACNVTGAAAADFGAVGSHSLADAYASEFLVGIGAAKGGFDLT